MPNETTYTVFAGHQRVLSGGLKAMLVQTKLLMDRGDTDPVLIFEDHTGRQIDFDFRGTTDEVVERAAPVPRAGPGRPRLGVVSREVSLLPRHWDWLEQQPNGLSAALRRLVDEARKRDPGEERARLAREAAGRFMTAVAGDLPAFEEASRALYAKDKELFRQRTSAWPEDVRVYLEQLLQEG
jgi:hypothetical protein